MARLGYHSYVAQSGDWGSAVTHSIAWSEAPHCRAIHLNLPLVGPSAAVMSDLSEQERAALARIRHYFDWDYGTATVHSTRPQALDVLG